jgi:hypothetical protein
MKNLFDFLSTYSKCPMCHDDLFTEIIIAFNATTKKDKIPYRLYITYLKNVGEKQHFQYIKYRDDNDRKYDPGFDRASNTFKISKSGHFIMSKDVFAIDSYSVYAYCVSDHFMIETQDIVFNPKSTIKLSIEEFKVKNYKVLNDYDVQKTKIYIDDIYPAKLSIKLTPFYSIDETSLQDIVSKIESLLVLT